MKKNPSDKLTPAELCMHLDAIQRAMDTQASYDIAKQYTKWHIVAMHARPGGWVSGIMAQRVGVDADFGMIVLRGGSHRETIFIDSGGSRTASWYINRKLFHKIEDHVNAINRHYHLTRRANARGREETISPDMP